MYYDDSTELENFLIEIKDPSTQKTMVRKSVQDGHHTKISGYFVNTTKSCRIKAKMTETWTRRKCLDLLLPGASLSSTRQRQCAFSNPYEVIFSINSPGSWILKIEIEDYVANVYSLQSLEIFTDASDSC